jgi:hypothetical protein
MSNDNWKIVKPRKSKKFNQKPNEKTLKKTIYGTSCLYCHEEGHWQWECPKIRCKNCGELGHKICDKKFQPEKSQRVVNSYSHGPVFMKICQECGRKETACIPVNEKHYIINSEYIPSEDKNIVHKYGALCLNCENKFQKRMSKAKGEYKPVECNHCGKSGTKDTMEQLQEKYEPEYYCDLNCLYAKKILLEGKIDEKRLEILLKTYIDEGIKYKRSQYEYVTKEEIIERLKRSEMLTELLKEYEAKKQQQQYYESLKKAVKENDFGKDFSTYFKEVILQDPEINELIEFQSERTFALEKSLEFKNKQLKEYNCLQVKYGNLTEFIEKQFRNNQRQQKQIQQLEKEIAIIKEKFKIIEGKA